LALFVSGLSDKSLDAVTKVRGPSKKVAFDQTGNPTKALLGFAKSLGIEPTEITTDDSGGEYVYGERREAGRAVADVLGEVLPVVVMGLESPYPLRWGEQGWRWYRPIRWVVSLYGRDVVPLSIAGIPSGRRTLGHRTLHPGPADVASADEYMRVMERVSVVVDPELRAAQIVEGAKRAALQLGGTPVIDDELLSEVTSLCEHPSAFLGRFEARYSALPKEVLVTAMRHHQRYFPVEDSQGNVLPGFVGVRDGDPSIGLDTVRSGNEWVLRARLEDAEFFYEQDKKVHLGDRLPDLTGVRFLKNSGTMLDKAKRMEQVAAAVASSLGLSKDEAGLAVQAARLAKADLVTAMVRELPELEGVMGGRYGELESLPTAVTAALRDQYLPRGSKDRLPDPGVASVVALTDKLDTLAVSFSLGMEVSGSADPFGLRRNAMGIVAIIMGRGYDADLAGLLDLPLELAAGVVPSPAPDAAAKLLQFLLSRVEGALVERGFGVEVTRAVLFGGERRIARLPKMAEALAALVGSPRLGDVVTGWRRTSVLAKSVAAARENVSADRLVEDSEKALYRAYEENKDILDSLYANGEYSEYLGRLANLRASIDRCLDEVLIMAEDLEIRTNRIALLKAVSSLFTRYADFSHVLPLVGREG
jgi:glycyl-tRNA synthetase beta chain